MTITLDGYRQRWQDACNRGDFDAVARLYAENAVFYDFRGGTYEGRDAIRDAMRTLLEELRAQANGHPVRFESRLTEERLFGDAGYLMGTYAYVAPDGARLLEGHFAVIGEKAGTEWQILRHMSTAKIAMPTPEKKLVTA